MAVHVSDANSWRHFSKRVKEKEKPLALLILTQRPQFRIKSENKTNQERHFLNKKKNIDRKCNKELNSTLVKVMRLLFGN